jgi:hypothetical protein
MNAVASVRLHAPVFPAGSRLSATITLSRPSKSTIDHSGEGSGDGTDGGTLRVAYVVAQVAGRWVSDRSWLRPAAHAPPRGDGLSLPPPAVLDLHAPAGHAWDAALDDAFHAGGGFAAAAAAANGHAGVIFRSAALPVCVDEPLPPGARTAFDVACVLPDPVPATFRGTAMRYSYSLLVVVAPADPLAAPHILRVPFRVVPRDEDPDVVLRPANEPATTASSNGLAQSPSGPAPHPARRPALIIAVPTPRDTGPAPSRFLEAAPASALSMTVSRAKNPAPTDIEFALAVSQNGRLTPYRTDEELWKHGSTGGDDDSALSLIRYIPPLAETTTGDPTPGSVADIAPHIVSSAAHSAKGLGVSSIQSPPLTPKFAAVHSSSATVKSTDPNAELINDIPNAQRKSHALPVYQISRESRALARVYLSKRVHHLGETITAVCDFLGPASSRVYRLNARLECQEVIQPAHALGTKNGLPPARGLVFRKVYGEHGEFVMLNHNTHVTFSIPYDAPVTFATTVVEIRWFLHFVFLIPKSSAFPERSSTSSSCAAGRSGDAVEDSKISRQVDADTEADSTTPLRPGCASMDGIGSTLPMPADRDEAVANGDLHRIDTEQHHGAKLCDFDGEQETPEWLGGDWRGNDPNAWARILPARETEALHWALPLVVMSRQGSQWGACPFAQRHIDR